MSAQWEFRINPRFKYARAFSEDLAAVETEEIRDLWGYIDPTGRLVIEPKFEFIEMAEGHSRSGFSHGLAVVADEDLNHGFINPLGEYVNSIKFENAGNFYDGLAKVSLRNRWGFIDRQFKVAIGPLFEDVGSFSEGLAYARMERNGKWGFIDKTGNFKIPISYESAGIFSDGLAAICINKKWGYIDKNNEMKIKPEFDVANQFSNGLAAVELNNKLSFIDTNGNIIITTNYRTGDSFSEGLALVATFDHEEKARMDQWADKQYREKGILFQRNESSLWKWGYIDSKGEIAIPIQFQQAGSFSNGLAAVQVKDKWGYIAII